MAELWVRKLIVPSGAFLAFDGPESQVVFDKLPFNKSLFCEVKQPRSLQHLKLYWSIVHRIVNALDRADVNDARVDKFFKRGAGLYVEYETKTFGKEIEYGSIAFKNMDQIAFREFFEKCIRFAYVEWGIPDDVFSDLLQESKR